MSLSFKDLLDENIRTLMTGRGISLIQQIGIEVIKSIVLDVLTGKNIRNSTEILTRKRIVALNLATLNLFVKGVTFDDQFIEQLPELAIEILTDKTKKQYTYNTEERDFALWILGLTGKGVQNVLGDDMSEIRTYQENYIRACKEIIAQYEHIYGVLDGQLAIGAETKATVNWLFICYLLNTVGTQTLKIRGSDKSRYGKFFEKLILGALLSILGFEYQPQTQTEKSHGVFWLSSTDQRESDATLLIAPGKAVRFDIGFIGRGNSEISADKITRYQSQISIGSEQYFSTTLILVDKIGKDSKLTSLAAQIDAPIVQMSGSYWPQRVAKILHQRYGLEHPLATLLDRAIGEYIQTAIAKISLQPFMTPDILNTTGDEA